MAAIILNSEQTYQENRTSKYWRDIKCQPQTVELGSWGAGHPVFYLNGIVTDSHDNKEIGTQTRVCVQTYSFNLDSEIYTIVHGKL